MKSKHPILNEIFKGRFTLLLISIVVMFLVIPLIPAEKNYLDRGIGLFSFVVLFSCLRSITAHRGFLIFMVILTLINVGIGSTAIFANTTADILGTVGPIFRLTYYLLIFGSIMGYVLDKSPVTKDKILGSISAYLLIGMIWASIYSLFFHITPESFSIPTELQSDSVVNLWSIYFSFTTLTTLGYGDIVPRSHAVQNYAVMEAAFGQIFLTVLIARLVALQIIHTHTNPDKEP